MAETPKIQGPKDESGRRGGRRRMGRLVETTVVLDREDLAALDAVAVEEGRSRSELIREAIRRTWITGRRPSRPAAQPAAPSDSGDPNATEVRTAWQRRFGSLLTDLRESAVTDLSEEELTEFIQEEIEARRREKRESQKHHAGGR